MVKFEFFKDYGEANRYQLQEVIGKGSYGIVCSAIDKQTGEKVAIKKITDVFEHVSDATRILREIKLLRFLRHPDIVQIKHILLPPSPRDFRDIYVVFELMEADLHQVIKANDDLTPEHFQFFLYQLLRALKFMHSANVFHRDLKPKNILANGDCKLKICDFGLARVNFNDTATAIFWTDYVATRWYRAPELCGSFYSRYTTAVDIWSIGCIFAELVTGKPLFPGKNVVHQLDIITDLLGTPSAKAISQIQNEKAKRYLSNMRKKSPIPFQQRFPNLDPLAVKLLQRLLAFDPRDRPTAQEALADAYFKGLAKAEREPSSRPASKEDFHFEKKRLTEHDLREMIYQEILEYHPQIRKQSSNNGSKELHRFVYPSAIDQLKKQFDHLQKDSKDACIERRHCSLPREHSTYVNENENKHVRENNGAHCPQNKKGESRTHLAPQKFIQGESLNDRQSKAPVTSDDDDDAKLKKTISFSEHTNSVQSQLMAHAKFNRSLRIDQDGRKNFWNETRAHQRRSDSVVASVTRLADSNINSKNVIPKRDQDNEKKQEDVKVTHSRTRPMGATVAKLVAAFSNGMG